mgnify:CR=1 FL=1
MLGLGDGWVFGAFVLCIASVSACVVYGIANWNKGADAEIQEIKEELKWQSEDSKIDENF